MVPGTRPKRCPPTINISRSFCCSMIAQIGGALQHSSQARFDSVKGVRASHCVRFLAMGMSPLPPLSIVKESTCPVFVPRVLL